jgi:hypothetical protein
MPLNIIPESLPEEKGTGFIFVPSVRDFLQCGGKINPVPFSRRSSRLAPDSRHIEARNRFLVKPGGTANYFIAPDASIAFGAFI